MPVSALILVPKCGENNGPFCTADWTGQKSSFLAWNASAKPLLERDSRPRSRISPRKVSAANHSLPRWDGKQRFRWLTLRRAREAEIGTYTFGVTRSPSY